MIAAIEADSKINVHLNSTVTKPREGIKISGYVD